MDLRTAHLDIGAARVEDSEAIAQLHIRVWKVAYRGQISDSYLDRLDHGLPRRVEWRRDLLAGTGGENRTWLAHLDGCLVGFADTCPSRDEDAAEGTGEVSALYVDQSLARRGIGRALMSRALSDLQARGFTCATLWVLASNERARRFYEAMGWKPDGREKVETWPGLELHELRYRIDLGP